MSTVINFYKDESGAVTVDWVVLTAAIVGIAIAVISLISGGVEDASVGINDELVVASNFTFGGSDANWASGYSPLSGQHGDIWSGNGVDDEGRTWAENTYDNWSVLSDEELVSMYNQDYLTATTTYDPTRADYVAVQETILTERGIPIPDGNRTAADIRANYET
jgi:Flp pilus assembly pilin Flp